jgi:hypothetical protein
MKSEPYAQDVGLAAVQMQRRLFIREYIREFGGINSSHLIIQIN